jgi:hypothetical protein
LTRAALALVITERRTTMFHRLRKTNPAVVAAALTVLLMVAVGSRDAFAFLTIDWLSCRSELAYDREYGWWATGREICDLVETGPGIIFRPEPQQPRGDRLCFAKNKKAEKALKDAINKLTKLGPSSECAKALNGPRGTALDIANTIQLYAQFDGCAGQPPKPDVFAQASGPDGEFTTIRFFDPFFGSLAGFKYLEDLNDDNYRRQMVALHELAHATGRYPKDDAASEQAINEAVLAKCFGIGEKGNPVERPLDENGFATYPDATAASNDANDGVIGDDGSGEPPTADVFTADPDGSTIPPDDGGGDGGGDILPLIY